jgi:hypothetical protein
MRKLLQIIALMTVTASPFFAIDSLTIAGKVFDGLGKPLEGATVIIWRAGVKKGYSTYCPSCYRDCGKRTVTDQLGSFTIKNVSPDLWFTLLVVRHGYTPTFTTRVDPSNRTPESVTLSPRPTVDDPSRIVRGRIVDPDGRALRDAVVKPLGVATASKDGPRSKYGAIRGLEPLAVTNPGGEFELAYDKRATGMLLQVEARGMATKLVAVPTGTKRKSISVFDGAVIRGRLVNHGSPVSGAEVGLIARVRGGFEGNLKISGNPYQELRIGTQEDGSFLIPNVPTPVTWYVYAKMESIAALGATDPVEISTTRDGEVVNVGNIQITPGHKLHGTVRLSNGAQIADGMRITISAERAWDSQTVTIGRDGSFEFVNLPKGKYEVFASVQGYRLPGSQDTVEITISEDIDDFVIVLEPSE